MKKRTKKLLPPRGSDIVDLAGEAGAGRGHKSLLVLFFRKEHSFLAFPGAWNTALKRPRLPKFLRTPTEPGTPARLPLSRYSRDEKLLAGLDLQKSKGLEIGALATPVLRPPRANIRYVDHADQAALRAKYANDPNVALDDIVPVDAVWGDKTLSECFPGEHFDYVIASHVMEHVPDLIGWLAEIAAVLREDGRLVLAVPDRRYSFDLIRRETSLADLIGTHLDRARRPTPAQVFDFCANSVAFDHVVAWNTAAARAQPKRYGTTGYALQKATESRDGHYVDGHCSVFTARSLLALLDGLLDLGLLPYRLERFHVAPVGSAEMSLILRRQPATPDHEHARTPFRHMLAEGTDSEGLPLE